MRKKNGTIRVVANFKRTINKVQVDLDPYPTPRIDQLFHKIGEGNKYFATLVLRRGYRQIVIDERDRRKTVFTNATVTRRYLSALHLPDNLF